MSREFKVEWKSKKGSKPLNVLKTLQMILGVTNVVLSVLLVKLLRDRYREKTKK